MVNHIRAWISRLPRRALGYTTVAVAAALTISTAAWSGAAPAAHPAFHAVRRAVAVEPPVNWKMPLIGAHRTTLTDAAAAAGFAVPMPDVASPIRTGSGPAGKISLTLSQVWETPAREIALVFNGGKVTMLVGPATYKHAGQAFRTELAAIKVGRAAIDRVNGKPALVVQPRTDYTKSNPALVEVYRHGLDINVISTKLGTRTLRAIAASMPIH
jgi:hypothetical protein